MPVNTERRRQWHPTPVLLPGKSHGRRSLVGCSPWVHTESDTTERLNFHFSLSCIGEGHDWSDLAAVNTEMIPAQGNQAPPGTPGAEMEEEAEGWYPRSFYRDPNCHCEPFLKRAAAPKRTLRLSPPIEWFSSPFSSQFGCFWLDSSETSFNTLTWAGHLKSRDCPQISVPVPQIQ